MRKTTYAVGALTIAAAVVFARTLSYAAIYRPDGSLDGSAAQDVLSATAAEKKVPAATLEAYPSRLIIPSLGIDAPFEDVGTTASGSIGTPDDFTSVAWYDHSAIPGKEGTAIIDGHVDNGLGLAGVFKKLSGARRGDAIEVVTRSGAKLSFTVTDVASYGYGGLPSYVLSGPAGAVGSYIELITCGGAWVPDKRTYDQRLVVTARLDEKR
ncbi:MAG: class F sortase [Patescibacteria group bacterium]|nr:class F sortase [Patescibacteria group bacterium]